MRPSHDGIGQLEQYIAVQVGKNKIVVRRGNASIGAENDNEPVFEMVEAGSLSGGYRCSGTDVDADGPCGAEPQGGDREDPGAAADVEHRHPVEGRQSLDLLEAARRRLVLPGAECSPRDHQVD